MKLSLALLLFLSFSTHAFAHSAYRACAENNPALCATFEFSSPIDTKVEGVFVVTVETPGQQPIQNFALNLWMNMGSMGHPGAPVEIMPLDQNRFQIQNAWFVMKGTWLIQMDFTFESNSYHLEIPLNVKQ